VNYWFQRKYIDINIKAVYLDAIPIHKINEKNPKESAICKELIAKVEERLTLSRESPKSGNMSVARLRANRLDSEIDQLVYGLYGIEDKELVKQIEASVE
jgi:hypothetical protein